MGKGALARVGQFWYPVRLIRLHNDMWTVKWWREDIFNMNNPVAGGVSDVNASDIIDLLWKNRQGRRNIRVSKATILHITILNS